MEENLDLLIQGIEPEVIDQELILDGTGINYRIKKLRYLVDTDVIDEIFEYKHSAYHPGWSAISKRILQEGSLSTEETYREWTISNHPVQTEIKRKVYLVQLGITKKRVLVLLKMEHYNTDWTPALVGPQMIQRIWDDKTMVNHLGQMITEREYWDVFAVEQGMTPYQILDQRVPQMDTDGLFNTY